MFHSIRRPDVLVITLAAAGILMVSTGTWMWYADMALAILAALVNLPIKEDAVTKPQNRLATGRLAPDNR